MPCHPPAPPPPVLPVSDRVRRRLERMTAALADPGQRAALARADWLPAGTAETLVLVDDPDFRRLATGFRGLQARPEAAQPAPPRGLRTLLDRLERRYPQAFAAFRALAGPLAPGAEPARGGHDVRSVVLVPTSVIYIVLVPGRCGDEPGRAFLEVLARMAPARPAGAG